MVLPRIPDMRNIAMRDILSIGLNWKRNGSFMIIWLGTLRRLVNLELSIFWKTDREKSAKISEQKPIKFNFYRAIRVDSASQLRFTDELFFCNDKTAPEFRSDSKYFET